MATTKQKLKRAFSLQRKAKQLEVELSMAYSELEGLITELNALGESNLVHISRKPLKPKNVNAVLQQIKKLNVEYSQRKDIASYIKNSTQGINSAIGKKFQIKVRENVWNKLTEQQQKQLRDLYAEGIKSVGLEKFKKKAPSINEYAEKILRGTSIEGLRISLNDKIHDYYTIGCFNNDRTLLEAGASAIGLDFNFEDIANIRVWMESLIGKDYAHKADLHDYLYAFAKRELDLDELEDLLEGIGYTNPEEM